MKIAVFGTGMVGQAHAGRLAELGHEVVVGTHDVEKTMQKDQPDMMGNPPYKTWQESHPSVKLVSFSEAAAHGELIFAALHGEGAVELLKSLENELGSKVLVDITNPLDFSKGMPPTLFVCNDNSLGEEIQKALPQVRVVKAFNTLTAHLQVNPQELAGGEHTLFMCGNEAMAKQEVQKMAEAYGWKDIIDLGDITNARGMEMLLPFWLRAWGALKTANFNYKIVR